MRDKLYLWPYEYDCIMPKEARKSIYHIDSTDPVLLTKLFGLLRCKQLVYVPENGSIREMFVRF